MVMVEAVAAVSALLSELIDALETWLPVMDALFEGASDFSPACSSVAFFELPAPTASRSRL